MTNVKKVYAELVELLETNKDKKVSSILQEVYTLAESKQSSKNFVVNDKNVVTQVFCYYHKTWETISDVDYGTKKHSASGYNSMCKIGVNQWSKQQRNAKKEEADLLNKLSSGQVSPDKIQEIREEIEKNRKVIIPLSN